MATERKADTQVPSFSFGSRGLCSLLAGGDGKARAAQLRNAAGALHEPGG